MSDSRGQCFRHAPFHCCHATKPPRHSWSGSARWPWPSLLPRLLLHSSFTVITVASICAFTIQLLSLLQLLLKPRAPSLLSVSRFGTVTSCDIIRDFKTGDSLNYGFIGFDRWGQRLVRGGRGFGMRRQSGVGRWGVGQGGAEAGGCRAAGCVGRGCGAVTREAES